MSTHAAARPEARTVAGGTVFDIGYRGYDGPREGRNRGRLAVFKNGVRTAMGVGRGPRAKILPWFFIGLLNLIGLIMTLVAAAMERMQGPGTADQMNLHGQFYGVASVLLFLFAALVAPELLCRDRRERTINLYLVRPLTGTDYVFSRYAAFLAVMLFAAWLPHFVLFFGLLMDQPAPATYLAEHWLDVPRFLAAGLVTASYLTGLALLAAAFTTRRAYASVFLIGVLLISSPFTLGLAQELGGAAGRWLSMFNLTNIPAHVNDLIFGGEPAEITEDAPARELGATVLVAWWALWTLGPAAILWGRYRRLSP